ncbi:MAG: hypothetical protein FD180_827 [Planctomycetota bacterium]|nr:MAG: hypothetical protein FD180_827 [Planctomycetota bacterium]
MRFLLTAGIWIVFAGSVALFTSRRDARGPVESYARGPARGIFAVEVTASFAAEPDPFALDTGKEKAAGLVVRVNGVEAIRAATVRPGEALRAEPVKAVLVGKNELFIEAYPPQDQLNRSHAIRVRVLRDGEPVAEKTFWSEPGTPVAVAFALEVPAAGEPAKDEHDDH